MRPILDSRIFYDGQTYSAECPNCKTSKVSRYKLSIRRMLANGHCKNCAPRYNATGIQKTTDGKWVSHCPSCGAEQLYTRADHARSSERQGWTCRGCATKGKNTHVGDEKRLYNKFRKSANDRGIPWNITFQQFIACYDGKCALTGWDLSMSYGSCTASFDRIDSTKPYDADNIQWVHTMVNMCKNKYAQGRFVEMCKAVADKVKW